MRRGALVAAVVVLGAAAAATVAVVLTQGGSATTAARGEQRTKMPTSPAARFAVLSKAHSNRCGMPASALDRMPPGAHLQGACCFPMEYRSYVNQVHHLRRYAAVDVIPADPYDIPVSLAKQLIGYDSIELTPGQKRIYDSAKPLSATKGPCCCPCWRWTAFSGQAKYLITRRSYSAKQIADVWTLEEGCGGPSHSA